MLVNYRDTLVKIYGNFKEQKLKSINTIFNLHFSLAPHMHSYFVCVFNSFFFLLWWQRSNIHMLLKNIINFIFTSLIQITTQSRTHNNTALLFSMVVVWVPSFFFFSFCFCWAIYKVSKQYSSAIAIQRGSRWNRIFACIWDIINFFL